MVQTRLTSSTLISKLQDDIVQIRNNILFHRNYFIYKADRSIACPVNSTGGPIEGEINILRKCSGDNQKKIHSPAIFFDVGH